MWETIKSDQLHKASIGNTKLFILSGRLFRKHKMLCQKYFHMLKNIELDLAPEMLDKAAFHSLSVTAQGHFIGNIF